MECGRGIVTIGGQKHVLRPLHHNYHISISISVYRSICVCVCVCVYRYRYIDINRDIDVDIYHRVYISIYKKILSTSHVINQDLKYQ